MDLLPQIVIIPEVEVPDDPVEDVVVVFVDVVVDVVVEGVMLLQTVMLDETLVQA